MEDLPSDGFGRIGCIEFGNKNGLGIRLEHLTPIPRGNSLQELSEKLILDVEQAAREKKRRDGRTVMECFEQEQKEMLVIPSRPFDSRKVVLCSVNRSALVKVEGVSYSVPSNWRLLDATVYIGVDKVEIVCRGERVIHPRKRKGEQSIQYRHYLVELSRKPQALRQVIVELLAELGEPYGMLWRQLVDEHGPKESARLFAEVLGELKDHTEQEMAQAIRQALKADRLDLLCLSQSRQKEQDLIVPLTLSHYQIDGARATDYDQLLLGGVK